MCEGQCVMLGVCEYVWVEYRNEVVAELIEGSDA